MTGPSQLVRKHATFGSCYKCLKLTSKRPCFANSAKRGMAWGQDAP